MNNEIFIEEIVFVKYKLKFIKGQKFQLQIAVTPFNYTSNITWITSNPCIMTVNNGMVTAMGNGNVTITAKSSDEKKASGFINITVGLEQSITPQHVSTLISRIIFKSYPKEIYIGEKIPLDIITLPSTSVSSVNWYSDNIKVIKVDENGIITGISSGTAKIIVQSTDKNSVKNTITIKVNNNIYQPPIIYYTN